MTKAYAVPGRRIQVGIVATDAEPANGEVVTYRLTPEEIAARYGPPGRQKGERSWKWPTKRGDVLSKNKHEGDTDMTAFETYPKGGRKKMTITQALEHRDFMAKEAECMTQVMVSVENIQLTERVNAMLTAYQKGCEDELERLTKAFASTTIEV